MKPSVITHTEYPAIAHRFITNRFIVTSFYFFVLPSKIIYKLLKDIVLIYPSQKPRRLDTQGPEAFLIHLLFYFQLNI